MPTPTRSSLEARHGWVLYHDSQGYPYYHNAASGESVWALSATPHHDHTTHVSTAISPETTDPAHPISSPYSPSSRGSVVPASTDHHGVRDDIARGVTDFYTVENFARSFADHPDDGSRTPTSTSMSADENSSKASGELSDPDSDDSHESSDDNDDAALLEFDGDCDHDSEVRTKFSAMLATPEGQAALQAEMHRVERLMERKRRQDYESWRRSSGSSVPRHTLRTEPRVALVVRHLIFVPVLLFQRKYNASKSTSLLCRLWFCRHSPTGS